MQTKKEIVTKKIIKNKNVKQNGNDIDNKTYKKNKNKQNINNDVKKGNWSKKEDEILKKWVVENGANLWTECSQQIRGRCGKQCRERWVNTLDPKVKKGNWEIEDQELIFELLKEHFTSWSSISKNIIGRTENSIKNFFYSTIRRLKSNVIINFLKDFQNKNLEDEKIYQLIDKMQIKSINHLSFLIIKFILKNNEEDQRLITLRKYLCQLLLEDLNKKVKKIQINTNEQNNNTKETEDNVIENNMLENNIQEDENEIINHSINLKDIKNNSSLQENLNIFIELLNNLKYTNPSQKIKINIPQCWNCQKKQDNCHIDQINKLFSEKLNGDIKVGNNSNECLNEMHEENNDDIENLINEEN